LNLGGDGNHALIPNNYIIGNLHGKDKKLCSGSKDHPRECHPNGTYDFIKGDVIDFTWGMLAGQVGELAYMIEQSDVHDELRKRTRSQGNIVVP